VPPFASTTHVGLIQVLDVMPDNLVSAFKPIYGWGWRQGDHSIDVPEPFELLVAEESVAVVTGVVQPPHKFSGCNAKLTFRGELGGLRQWNVIFSGKSLADPITGNAQSNANDV
jgi:hypothetical protein